MKETNIWLSPEELQHMLHGSLQWIDVASRTTSSRAGIRKLGGNISEKQSAPQHVVSSQSASRVVEQIENYQPNEEMQSLKKLEGQPVIWLLGSVGLLTLYSWFYFVLFSK